ncbi:MAG: sigma-70 family RNA polymerase sigma factor [Clostridia bacterium]|jgi:RNA polymerase sigma factor, sigma-70 family|nr:sigma-70 family RNA polymerase sigma factor [Clostridia bacterium]HCA54890.1 RNA polymerase subunit sigma-70 [Oscillospiraceae bacterium]
MEDSQIVALFFSRSEKAISAAAEKYEKYCRSIAFGILNDDAESEECVNDVFLKAWESIPPKKPSNLSGYLAKLTRNHAINSVRCRNAVKRGSGQITLALEELEECIPDKCDVERQMEQSALTGLLNEFLASLPVDTRRIFMRRYWYLSPVKEIASDFGISESKVKMQLLRARKKLKTKLEREGFE